MKKRILFIVFISFSSIVLGQVYEIGLSLGGTNYVGDIGRTNYIYPNQLAGNVFFKYNYNPRIALRGTFSYLPISGNDANADTNFRKNRGLNFSNTINELALGMEYNFYEYDISSEDKNWTPYILVELAALNYSYVKGQNPADENIFDKKTAFAIPIGVGFKSKLSGSFAFSLETKFRYSFKDDLDFTSEKNTNLNIEGNSNDWYMFTGVSLIYTFGRPACYTQGL
ncbi:hypothetical protein CW731_13525 [Polaribacter sp. ALD11]|uniref:type IX secretion system protein PorG n=1 Tax=Polaribacter sp. ALD11 TaxID=2058137 RepID=UPI000C31755A|nr:DUF6089 family protein [Polaribacter sp. ALD11]AUC86233.1 hypothetical protein CW731_13525 [Polaribacter sp. ALD11]